MNFRFKPILSVSLATLMGLAVTCGANAAQSHGNSQMNRQIQICVSEIRRHSDFEAGSRVMHWVVSFEQRNLAEARIGIETTVKSGDSNPDRKFETSCVTDTMGKLVEFRISQSGSKHLAVVFSNAQGGLVA